LATVADDAPGDHEEAPPQGHDPLALRELQPVVAVEHEQIARHHLEREAWLHWPTGSLRYREGCRARSTARRPLLETARHTTACADPRCPSSDAALVGVVN